MNLSKVKSNKVTPAAKKEFGINKKKRQIKTIIIRFINNYSVILFND